MAAVDWSAYLADLSAEETRLLAAWLAAQGLGVGEFIEVVDRAYAATPDRARGPAARFVVQLGRTRAEAYARRKRRFAGLAAALEQARMSGALPGEVAARELEPSAPPWPVQRQVEEVLGALARARRGLE